MGCSSSVAKSEASASHKKDLKKSAEPDFEPEGLGIHAAFAPKIKHEDLSKDPHKEDLEKPAEPDFKPEVPVIQTGFTSKVDHVDLSKDPHKKDLEKPAEPDFKPEVPVNQTGFTFKVDTVELSKGPHNLVTAESILRNQILSSGNFDESDSQIFEFKGRLEDFSHRKDKDAKYLKDLSPHVTGLIGMIHNASESCYAVSLSASDFILLIAQELGFYINRIRDQGLVEHEEELSIEVTRNHFLLEGQNDWSATFGEIAEQIQGKFKPDVHEVIRDNTSTAKTAVTFPPEIALNYSMQVYFQDEVQTGGEIPQVYCGIPEITLEGVPADWQKLKDKVTKLVEMNKDDCLGLKRWLDHLVPIVDKICETGIEHKVDRKFWRTIYRYHNSSDGQSDGDRIAGWILRFFCAISHFEMNHMYYCENMKASFIPKQVREVLFTWNCNEKKIKMNLSAGFLGAELNKELCQVKAVRFWSVTRTEDRPEWS